MQANQTPLTRPHSKKPEQYEYTSIPDPYDAIMPVKQSYHAAGLPA